MEKNNINIYNSKIIIENYMNGDYTKLLNSLSVWSERAYTRGKYVSWRAYQINNKSKELIIHKGINLQYLKKIYPSHNINYYLNGNPYYNFNDINLITKPRNQLQIDSINFLLNNNDTQKFLCLKPGDGKTYCAINYIMYKKINSVIIVDNDKLIKQWKDSFLKFTNIKEDDIFIISGSPSLEKLLDINYNNNYKIFIASHRTIDSFSSKNKNGFSILDRVFFNTGIGIKIFDEAHVEWKNIFDIDVHTNTLETIYLTATPDRSNPAESKVYQKLFGNIDMFGLEEFRDKKHITYIEYKWNSHPSDIDKANMKNNYGFDSNSYNEYILSKRLNNFIDFLNNNIMEFIFTNNIKKIAIVVNCNNLVQKLYEIFSQLYPDKKIGRYCGIIPVKERAKELDKDIIITTIKGFNKGVDVNGLEVVVNTVSIASSVIMEQLSGRLRYNKDYKSYFFQMTDMGFKEIIRHSKIRNETMQNIACKSYTIQAKN
jgi:superfamily II DNA or RNA helicase